MSALVLDQGDPSRPDGPSRPEEPALRSPRIKVVAILDGSPMVARVLELLLRGCGYGTRLVEDAEPDRPERLPLEGVDLVVLAPSPSTEHSETLLASIRSVPETAHLPVILMLSEAPQGAPDKETRVLVWPCRTEELVREIEAILATADPDTTKP